MELLIDEILADIEWRVSELATIKSLPIKYAFRDDHKEIQIKYSIPALYAIWEGFVKSTFVIYSNYLNSLNINRTDISISLLAHALDSECNFNNPRSTFDAKIRLAKSIDEYLCETIEIKPSIPTESNVNCEVLNKILERFCIPPVDNSYKTGLNKLLKFRNKIAHGENSLRVNMTHVTEFISLIESLMMDIVVSIEESAERKTYKKGVVCSI